MKTLYFECTSGISGDMTAAARWKAWDWMGGICIYPGHPNAGSTPVISTFIWKRSKSTSMMNTDTSMSTPMNTNMGKITITHTFTAISQTAWQFWRAAS